MTSNYGWLLHMANEAPEELAAWFDAEHVDAEDGETAEKRGCDYCEKGSTMYPRVADGEYDYVEAIVENSDLIVEIGNYDVVFKIEACPMCGRRL